MTISEDFQSFLSNIRVDNEETISLRYGEITSALNREFRDSTSKTANSLQVGSYGRWTAIKGISDLDMIYIMPQSKWDDYKNDGQYKLLKDTKAAIVARYPTTSAKVDRLIVQVSFSDFDIEVQPAFEMDDGSFKYPDTANGGSWKITKPRLEITEMREANVKKNRNLRRLCKMARAWKNKHGVQMGGLLIDTLAYNFLNSTDEYDSRGHMYYDWMCRDFFEYLADEDDHEFYAALGSRQRVKVRKKFQKRAKTAYNLCVKAIEASGQKNERQKWRAVFGNGYPAVDRLEKAAHAHVFRNTEQFAEDRFRLDVRYSMRIDCTVEQDGFRTNFLQNLLEQHLPLLRNKNLKFHITSRNFPDDCKVYWKILNRGEQAERRDQIRGQIVLDSGHGEKRETTNFAGEHLVECYAVRGNVVVARDRILVPISSGPTDKPTEYDLWR